MNLPVTRQRDAWGLVYLLALAIGISFFDRGNLAVAAPVLASDLHLSPFSLGLLLSGFFWTYAVLQIGAGWLVEHFEVRTVYAAAFSVWSGATLATSLMSSFAGLLSMRLLLGVGESVTYPATSHVLAQVIPEERRGLANALIDLGARIGPAAGTFCGGLIVAKAGWRPLFVITGVAGLLWLVPWFAIAPRVLMPESEARSSAATRDEDTFPAADGGFEDPGHSLRERSDPDQVVEAKAPGVELADRERHTATGWKQLLRRRAVWGTTGGLCGANYAWYFILNWLPDYLVRQRHFSLGSTAVWGSVPFILMAFSSVGGGVLADYLVARGSPPVGVRKAFLVTGLIGTALLLPTTLLRQTGWAVAGLLVSCLAFGVYASNLYALTQTLAGTEAAGRWTGFQNCCGNLAGLVSAIVTGWVIEKTGGFATPFFFASAACVVGAASFWFGVREKGIPVEGV